MLGLSDAWVARHGLTAGAGEYNTLGHNRAATFSYLVDRGVNLVVGHPWVVERTSGPRPRFGLRRAAALRAPLMPDIEIHAFVK